MVQRQDDRHREPEHLAADREQPALDVVDAFRGTGAMQVHREPIDPAGRLEAPPEAILEIAQRFDGDPPAATTPASRQRHDPIGTSDASTALMNPPTVPLAWSLSRISLALVDTERVEVLEGRRRRVEGVRLLAHQKERQAHHGWPCRIRYQYRVPMNQPIVRSSGRPPSR